MDGHTGGRRRIPAAAPSAGQAPLCCLVLRALLREGAAWPLPEREKRRQATTSQLIVAATVFARGPRESEAGRGVKSAPESKSSFGFQKLKRAVQNIARHVGLEWHGEEEDGEDDCGDVFMGNHQV